MSLKCMFHALLYNKMELGPEMMELRSTLMVGCVLWNFYGFPCNYTQNPKLCSIHVGL